MLPSSIDKGQGALLLLMLSDSYEKANLRFVEERATCRGHVS